MHVLATDSNTDLSILQVVQLKHAETYKLSPLGLDMAPIKFDLRALLHVKKYEVITFTAFDSMWIGNIL